MNGLKYIRTRCNISLSELAEIIGVTRQALNSWENGKKDIPEQRREQLARFFGVEKEYFGEIPEEKKKYLLEKAMFRYDDHGKETYRYKIPDGVEKSDQVEMCFIGDREISLDEEYILAQRKKQEVLEKIADIIKWTDHAGSIESQVVCINRGCTVYGMINLMMEEMRGMRSYLKMPFFYELIDVWKAMLLAYGLIDESDISYLDKTGYYCGEDGEWILGLGEQIKAHWDKEFVFHENHHQNIKRKKGEGRSSDLSKIKKNMSLEEKITDAEECNRQLMKEMNQSQIKRHSIWE